MQKIVVIPPGGLKVASPKPFQTISWEEQSKVPHTKPQLALWGVNWPPVKGWRKRLAAGEDPNRSPTPTPSRRHGLKKPVRKWPEPYGVYNGTTFGDREHDRWERRQYGMSYKGQLEINARLAQIRKGDW